MNSLPILLFLTSILLENCFFLLATDFAQILLSKFCQGLLKIAIIMAVGSDPGVSA